MKKSVIIRIIALIMSIIVCFSFCSCGISELVNDSDGGSIGDLFDSLLGINAEKAIELNYDNLSAVLRENIIKKETEYSEYFKRNDEQQSDNDLQSLLEKYLKTDIYAIYYCEKISFSTSDFDSYSKVSFKIEYNKDRISPDKLIKYTKTTLREFELSVQKELSTNGNISFAVISDFTEFDNDFAAMLIDSVSVNATLGYSLIDTKYSIFNSESGAQILQVKFSCDIINKNERISLNTELNKKADEIAEKIKNEHPKATKKEYCRAIHDYIVDNVEYYDDLVYENNMSKKEASIAKSTYGALLGKKTICGGYGTAFLMLYNKIIGDDLCRVIAGHVNGAELGHAWNAVVDNGTEYYIDCTSDDSNSNTDCFYKLPQSNAFSGYVPVEQYILSW